VNGTDYKTDGRRVQRTVCLARGLIILLISQVKSKVAHPWFWEGIVLYGTLRRGLGSVH
jgi:hypothetical protein